MQPSLFGSVQWTVSGLTKHIRDALESDAELQDVWVQGEISNLSRPSSGHVYFTLKDASASLRCVMWRSSAVRLGGALAEGSAAAVHGKIGVYEVGGQYQLYADQIRPAGEGALYQEFLRLKTALEAEGLFAAERKRPIPELPSRIGVVTSPTGAALRDVLNTLKRRLPLAEVTLATSAVQGEEAPAGLVEAITALNALRPLPDVILIVRGGGSIEDLWAFNNEGVVRAISASTIPIISGIGHETDFTLADFAADLRAPTPTAAAELATPISVLDLQANLESARTEIAASALTILGDHRNEVLSAMQDLRFQSPMRRIQTGRQQVDDLAHRAAAGQVHTLALAQSELLGLDRRLVALSPLEVLARGYAVVTREADGRVVRKVADARDAIRVRVSDGEFGARVVDQGRQK
jgi:exodeoxyribonuclease VII large subunit